MSKSKLAVVANSGWNIYNFRMDLINHLISRGLDVVVIAGDDVHLQKLQRETTWCIEPLMHMQEQGMHIGKEMLLFFEIMRLYRKHQPAIVLQFTIKPNLYGSLVARMMGIKAISNLTGLGVLAMNQGKVHQILQRLYQWALQFNSWVVFHNEEDLEWCVHRKIVGGHKALVIPGSGINVGKFVKRKDSQCERPFVFLMVARMIRSKGVWEFFKAGEYLLGKGLQCECWFVGNFDAGHQESLNIHEIEALKRSPFVRLIPFQDDVREVFEQADAFVLPSYREGLPKAMLEAMAMELPVVTTRVAGCRHAVEEGVTGVLVEPRDAMALARGMEQLMLNDRFNHREMGKRGRQRVLAKFESGVINSAYWNLLGETLEINME